MIPKNPFVEEVRVVTGIDLGASAIKMVSMRRNDAGKPEILKSTRFPLKGGPINLEEEKDRSRLITALKEAVAAHGIPLGVAVIGLSRERTIVRYLDLPSTTEAEVKEMLQYELERYVPFPLEKIQHDYSVIHQEEEGATVKVAAAPIEEIELFINLFEEAGIQVEVVDVDVLAVCGSYLYDTDDTTPVRAILDIGKSRSNLGVLMNDKVRFSRTANIGEDRLREYLEATEEEDLRPDERWVAELGTELKRMIKAFECEGDREEIKEVILCGGGARIDHLERQLGHAIDMRVRAVTPELHGIVGIDGVNAPEQTVAIGLALRSLDKPDINLIPQSVVDKRERAEQRRVTRNMGVYVGIILLLLGGIIGINFHAKYVHRAKLLTALAKIEPKIRDIQHKKSELDEISRNIDSENSFLNVLRDIYTITPDRVRYLSFSFEKRKQLDVRGQCVNEQEYLNLINVLKGSKHFKDVVPGSYKWNYTYDKVALREFDTTSCVLTTNDDYRAKRTRRR